MIPAFLLTGAAKLVGLRFARPAVIAAGIALLLALLSLGKCAYDRRIIERHDTRQALDQSEADRKADQKAAAQRRADDTRLNVEANELERITDNATSDMDRRLARHRCIRMQQQARRDGRVAPAC